MSPIEWSGIGVTTGVTAGPADAAVAVGRGMRVLTGTAGMLGGAGVDAAGVAPAHAPAKTTRIRAPRRMSGEDSPTPPRVAASHREQMGCGSRPLEASRWRSYASTPAFSGSQADRASMLGRESRGRKRGVRSA